MASSGMEKAYRTCRENKEAERKDRKQAPKEHDLKEFRYKDGTVIYAHDYKEANRLKQQRGRKR